MDQQKVDIYNRIEHIKARIYTLHGMDNGDNRVIYEMVINLEQEKDNLYEELFDIFEAEENNKYNLFEKEEEEQQSDQQMQDDEEDNKEMSC